MLLETVPGWSRLEWDSNGIPLIYIMIVHHIFGTSFFTLPPVWHVWKNRHNHVDSEFMTDPHSSLFTPPTGVEPTQHEILYLYNIYIYIYMVYIHTVHTLHHCHDAPLIACPWSSV